MHGSGAVVLLTLRLVLGVVDSVRAMAAGHQMHRVLDQLAGARHELKREEQGDRWEQTAHVSAWVTRAGVAGNTLDEPALLPGYSRSFSRYNPGLAAGPPAAGSTMPYISKVA